MRSPRCPAGVVMWCPVSCVQCTVVHYVLERVCSTLSWSTCLNVSASPNRAFQWLLYFGKKYAAIAPVRWFIRTLNFSHKLLLLWFPLTHLHVYIQIKMVDGVRASVQRERFDFAIECAIYQIDTWLGECGWHLQRRQLLVSINRCFAFNFVQHTYTYIEMEIGKWGRKKKSLCSIEK